MPSLGHTSPRGSLVPLGRMAHFVIHPEDNGPVATWPQCRHPSSRRAEALSLACECASPRGQGPRRAHRHPGQTQGHTKPKGSWQPEPGLHPRSLDPISESVSSEHVAMMVSKGAAQRSRRWDSVRLCATVLSLGPCHPGQLRFLLHSCLARDSQ